MRSSAVSVVSAVSIASVASISASPTAVSSSIAVSSAVSSSIHSIAVSSAVSSSIHSIAVCSAVSSSTAVFTAVSAVSSSSAPATADVREHVHPVEFVCQQWSVQRRWAGVGRGIQHFVSVRHGLRRLRWPGLLAAAQSEPTAAIATTAIAVVAAARVERGPL